MAALVAMLRDCVLPPDVRSDYVIGDQGRINDAVGGLQRGQLLIGNRTEVLNLSIRSRPADATKPAPTQAIPDRATHVSDTHCLKMRVRWSGVELVFGYTLTSNEQQFAIDWLQLNAQGTWRVNEYGLTCQLPTASPPSPGIVGGELRFQT